MKRDSKTSDNQMAIGSEVAGKGSGPKASDLPVDQEEMLPLLEEIVRPGDPVPGVWEDSGDAQPAAPPAAYRAAPGMDFERDILAYRLRTHFSEGLEQIVRAAVSTAVEHSVRDLEKTLQHELIESLESRLDQMVSRFLDDRTPGARSNGRDEDSG